MKLFFITILLLTSISISAQDFYYIDRNTSDSCVIHIADVHNPCHTIDSITIRHNIGIPPTYWRLFNFTIDEKNNVLYHFRNGTKDSNLWRDSLFVYGYDIEKDSAYFISQHKSYLSDIGLLSDVEFVEKDSLILMTSSFKDLIVYDLKKDTVHYKTHKGIQSTIAEVGGEYFLFSARADSIYKISLHPPYDITPFRAFDEHLTRSDCYGYCANNTSCITHALKLNSSLNINPNNFYLLNFTTLRLDSICWKKNGTSYTNSVVVDFHLLLDLDKGDDYCDNAHLELSLPCGSTSATLSTAAPQLTSTAEYVDSMQVYLSSSDGAYISVGDIPSTLRVSGDQSRTLWVYNTGSASLSDYGELIRGLTYHRGPSSKMSDQMIFLLHYEHHISEATIATITTSHGSPAYAGRDTTLTFCETDTPVALSQHIPRGADAGGTWLSPTTDIDPSLGATTHRYVVSNACNADTATLSIAVTPKALQDVSIDTLICAGDTFSIDGKAFARDTVLAYDRLSSAMPCGGFHYEIRVRVEQPTLDIQYPTDPLCAGDPPITLSIVKQAGYTYLWGDGVDSTQRVFATSGTYPIRATSKAGCVLHDTVTVMYHPKPLLELTQKTYREQQGTPITLDITTTSGIRIEWSPSIGLSCTDCPDPQLTVQDSIDYIVSVHGESGCTRTDTVFIRLQPTPEAPTVDIVLPSIIHPNSDIDANRYFGIVSSTVQSYDLAIYSRWGSKVFEQLNIDPNTQKGWDGSQHSTDLNTGVYVYSIQYTDSNGKTQQKVGTVTVVR